MKADNVAQTNAIKDAIYEYFEWYINEGSDEDLPTHPCSGEPDKRLFVGETNDEGWCRWKPAEKDEVFNSAAVARVVGFQLHESIIDYFNSYWFCTLLVNYEGIQYELPPVTPGHYQDTLIRSIESFQQPPTEPHVFTPFGFATGSNELLLIRNSDGAMLRDRAPGVMDVIAPSLLTFLKRGE